MGPLRSTYRRKCLFYAGQVIPVEIIWYWANKGAATYPDWHAFWPADLVNDGDLGTGPVGERKGRRKFTKGAAPWPDLDGSTPCGTQQQFEGKGQAPWLWSADSTYPTPAPCACIYRPALGLGAGLVPWVLERDARLLLGAVNLLTPPPTDTQIGLASGNVWVPWTDTQIGLASLNLAHGLTSSGAAPITLALGSADVYPVLAGITLRLGATFLGPGRTGGFSRGFSDGFDICLQMWPLGSRSIIGLASENLGHGLTASGAAPSALALGSADVYGVQQPIVLGLGAGRLARGRAGGFSDGFGDGFDSCSGD